MTDAILLAHVVALLPASFRRAAVATAGIDPGSRVFGRICARHRADEDAVALLNGWSRSAFDPKKWVPYERMEDAAFEGFEFTDPLLLARAVRRLVRSIVRDNRQFAQPNLTDAQLVERFEELKGV